VSNLPITSVFNDGYIAEQFEAFRKNPDSVDESWRQFFRFAQSLSGGSAVSATPATSDALAPAADAALLRIAAGGAALAAAIRRFGYLAVAIDPLGSAPPGSPELKAEFHGVTEAELEKLPASALGGATGTAADFIRELRERYSATLACEFDHLGNDAERQWLRQQIESGAATQPLSPEEKKAILQRLTQVDGLERFLGKAFVSMKRFSIEGVDLLVPMIDETIRAGARAGARNVVIGMAHRGRLNVLSNIIGTTDAGDMAERIFTIFEGTSHPSFPADEGDVKYHQGFSSDISTPGGPVHVTLAFNPSHLEIVNPVVEGSVRARQHRRHDARGDQVLPVLLHGDAAIAGQGVVQECLNMAQTRGYYTGGTIHIVINNQIGFTTSDPRDVRGTLYATDVAKMIEAPIFHVNGDDPEACLLATEIALDYRQRFHKDVFVDLVCFRRLGHNEADEPMITQPLMYKKINQHPGARKLYADRLIAEGAISADDAEAMVATYRGAMDKGYHTNTTVLSNYKPPFIIDWSPYKGRQWTEKVDTSVPIEKLKALGVKATDVPANFMLHPGVEKILAVRRAMVEGTHPVDWGMGEILAYATLLDQDYGVRLSGEDVGRGTFSHRHSVLHDQNREKWDLGTWIPLQHLKEGQPDFEVIDSVLTENAVLAFEYGYTTSEPNQLVIWEAQFGDFANGAQVVIDQFISAGEVKWGRICDLVLFLPHGYEGQGPEHSSARPERYLQLCAQHNMQVVVPTTPAQIFHLLRRQMLRNFRKPLITITPKSLLRHRQAVSSLDEFADGQWHNVIADVDPLDPAKVKRVIVCSGKVYYELLAYRREHSIDDVALLRLEQQYPFPHDDYKREVGKYAKATEVVWCQEEPQNQGAWYRLRGYMRNDIDADKVLAYAGRPVSASPAVGYAAKHNAEQKQLIEDAFAAKIRAREVLVAR
jgi:2-oxoglutarate dehydrogenase E1 component